MKEKVFEYAYKKYGTSPEYLWSKYPDTAVLRNADSRKWYAVLMRIGEDKLGLEGNDEKDIMDVKCDPLIIGSLRLTAGILPGYHMNKKNWITILLDGSVSEDKIFDLMDMSYKLSCKK